MAHALIQSYLGLGTDAKTKRDTLTALLYTAMLLASLLAGCSNEKALVAADQAKCRGLGFSPGSREYDVCLREDQRRRTGEAAPEQLRES